MRRFLATAGIVAVAVALASCGLEDIPVLVPPAPPEVFASDTTPVLQVLNQPTTVPSDWFFELKYGFELYYKFYNRDQPKDESLGDREALINAGYRRVSNATEPLSSQVLPLIPIDVADQNTEFDVTLDFSQPVASVAQYNGITARLVDVRRGVEHLGTAKTFSMDDLEGSDADLAETWAQALSDREIHLGVYALTYGMYNLSRPLYSTPQYLGFMVYHDIE